MFELGLGTLEMVSSAITISLFLLETTNISSEQWQEGISLKWPQFERRSDVHITGLHWATEDTLIISYQYHGLR